MARRPAAAARRLLLGCSVSALLAPAAAADLLILGDSWASLAGNLFENYCADSRVINFGVEGTRASDWAKPDFAQAEGIPNWPERLQREVPATVTKVWLSLGGNDVLGAGSSGCVEPRLAEDLETVVGHIRSAIPTAEIMLTNYGWPLHLPPLCPNLNFGMINEGIQGAVQALNDPRVVFLDLQFVFGARPDGTSSDTQLYRNDIHLNDAGYGVLFQLPQWQSFFCPDGAIHA